MATDALGLTDLINFNNSVVQRDPWGIAGQSLGAWQPNVSTWSPTETGVTLFAKSFLQGLFSNIAQNDAANQLSKVVSVLPQLGTDPASVGVPEGVDQSPFNVLKGASILNQAARRSILQDNLLANGVATNPTDQPLADKIMQATGQRAAINQYNQDRGHLAAFGIGSIDGVTPAAASPAVSDGTAPVTPIPVATGADGSVITALPDTPVAVVAKNPGAGDLQKQLANFPESPQYKAAQASREDLDNLRKEYNALDPVKDFQKVSAAADALSGALKDKHAVTDQELVRYSIQMIEPGMAVREGEQNAVSSSQSIPDAWKGQLSKALSGGSSLDDSVREGIKNLAIRAYNAKATKYKTATNFYDDIASSRGYITPGRSISYLGSPAAAESIFGSGITNIGAPDLASFIASAKARGLTKEQAQTEWAGLNK